MTKKPLKILLSAYACCPNMGSEQGVGWNWCVNLARYCELHIITEGEYRAEVETIMNQVRLTGKPLYGLVPEALDNLHFYYNPLPARVRQMCWNQGDWRFYWYYERWQRTTADIARSLLRLLEIDLLHQLNMIGFREPGYLWQVSRETGVKFVWGPIGGMKDFPKPFARDASLGVWVFLRLKNLINHLQMKRHRRVGQALRQASVLISAIPNSAWSIQHYKGCSSVVIPETGTYPDDLGMPPADRFHRPVMTILWVGKFDFRKRLDLALSALALAQQPNVRLKIFGHGSDSQMEEARAKARLYGFGPTSNAFWMGSIPNDQMKAEMRRADLLLFTSVSEDTSTVVLEAISLGLPVLCFDTCGMSLVVDDTVGIKIPVGHPRQAVEDFAHHIADLNQHRDKLVRMSAGCARRSQMFSWTHKAQQVVALYEQALAGTQPTAGK